MLRYVLLALLPPIAIGQVAPARTFEAASIKVHDGPMNRIGVSTSGLRLTGDAVNVFNLILYAYDLKGFQVTGTGPLFQDGDTRWDIMAKAEGDSMPTRAEFRQMLRTLLADRFQLKVHREMREMPVYALVVGMNGSKLKEGALDAEPSGYFHQKGRNLEITLTKASASDLVDAIGNAFLDRPVVDNTGLTGTYNVNLTYTPDIKANSEPDLSDINVFQALEEQLGLRLEKRKQPVDVLVVDRVEKPSAN
jgi:uncharacterized protein (TIGR03435 family)